MNPNRYSNLSAAGLALTESLSQYRDRADTVVLGIALAGVPVAYEVARSLKRPLDVILIRRLLIGDDGANLCAVNVAGETILDDGINLVATPSSPQEIFLVEAIADFKRR